MNNVRPHGAWFLLAPAFFLAGVAVAAALIATTATNFEDNRQRVDVPGETAISFDKAGSQAIYFEETGTTRARVPAGLRVSFTPEGGGTEIIPGPAGMSATYNLNGRAGILYGDVDLPAGRYRLKALLPDGAPQPNDAALVIGASPVGEVLGVVFGSIGVVGIGFVLALIAVVVVAVKRSRSRRELMAQYPAPMHARPMGPPPQQHGPRPAPPAPPDARQ